MKATQLLHDGGKERKNCPPPAVYARVQHTWIVHAMGPLRPIVTRPTYMYMSLNQPHATIRVRSLYVLGAAQSPLTDVKVV